MTYAILGARKGLTAAQFHALAEALKLLPADSVIRTPDELGAAEMGHFIARALHLDTRIASTVGGLLVECDALIACPSGPEDARSPTWQHVRMARELGKARRIIAADGTITKESRRK